jgi:hypothetical protein
VTDSEIGSTPGSLVNRSNMGGVIGAGGYDFQSRYTTCHALDWIRDPEFRWC